MKVGTFSARYHGSTVASCVAAAQQAVVLSGGGGGDDCGAAAAATIVNSWDPDSKPKAPQRLPGRTPATAGLTSDRLYGKPRVLPRPLKGSFRLRLLLDREMIGLRPTGTEGFFRR